MFNKKVLSLIMALCMSVFVLPTSIFSDVAPVNITVSVQTDNDAKMANAAGTSLADALKDVNIGEITDINILSGKVTVADWTYMKTGDFNKVQVLKVDEGITAVENFPDGKSSVDSLPKTLKSVSINKMTAVGDFAFANCKSLQMASFPDAIAIGDQSFVGCAALTNANVPGVISVGASAFKDCKKLQSISLPNVSNIGSHGFDGCTTLRNTDISSVSTIGEFAFSNCYALTTVNLPKVTTIPANAFNICENLTTAFLPSVRTINNYAFFQCLKLNTIKLTATPPAIADDTAFSRCGADRRVVFVNSNGDELLGDDFAKARDAYKSANDGDVTDNLWYGWKIGNLQPVKSLVFPASTPITYGVTLATSTLVGGVGDGKFEWSDTTVVPSVSDSVYKVVFTPTNARSSDWSLIEGWDPQTSTVKRNIPLQVSKKTISLNLISDIINQPFTGEEVKPKLTITDNGLITDNDYDVVYTNNIAEGTATATVTGKRNYTGTVSKNFNIIKAGKKSTSIFLAPGAPNIIAKKMDDLFTIDDQKSIANGESVSYQLDIQSPSGTPADAGIMKESIKGMGKSIGPFMDIKVLKTTKNKANEIVSNGVSVTQTNAPIAITVEIPDKYLRKESYTILRAHNGVVTEFLDLDANPKTITFETDKFSTYAITYVNKKVTNPTPISSFSVTSSATKGGTIYPNGRIQVGKFGSKTYTIKADKGYEIRDVIVNGKSMGNVVRYYLDNVTSDTTIEAIFKKVNDEVATIPDPIDVTHSPYMKGYQDNSFMPDARITRGEVATIFARVSEDFDSSARYGHQFKDVYGNEWYANFVGYAYTQGIIKGDEIGNFHPNDNITRGEFAAIAARYLGLNDEAPRVTFTDVNNHWALPYIANLVDKKIIAGYEDGTFRPDGFITRSESVKIVNGVLNRVPNKNKITIKSPFNDVSGTYWAFADILEASVEHKSSSFH